MITIGLMTNSVVSANHGVNALGISNILLIERSSRRLNIEHSYLLFGDVSRTEEQLTIIKSIDELKDIAVDIVPELEFRKWSSIVAFVKNVRCCDVIFDTSGGDSYSDIYGNKRMLHQYIPKWITLLLKKQLIAAPQTIGPFKSVLWEKLCARQLRKCRAVFVRDTMSHILCKNRLKVKDVYEVTDMAMILPYKEKGKKKIANEKMNIGLNVSGLLYSGGYTGENQFSLKSDYKNLTDRMIKMLTQEMSCEIYLVPHVITTGIESDNEVCTILKKKYPQLHYDGRFETPIEAKSYIAAMDLFIGARMHSTIAAVSSGVPVIPLSYSRKFEGLFGSIEYKECINLREEDEDAVLKKIKDCITGIGKMNDSVEKSNKIIEEKVNLYSSLLDGVLEKCNNEKK